MKNNPENISLSKKKFKSALSAMMDTIDKKEKRKEKELNSFIQEVSGGKNIKIVFTEKDIKSLNLK